MTAGRKLNTLSQEWGTPEKYVDTACRSRSRQSSCGNRPYPALRPDAAATAAGAVIPHVHLARAVTAGQRIMLADNLFSHPTGQRLVGEGIAELRRRAVRCMRVPVVHMQEPVVVSWRGRDSQSKGQLGVTSSADCRPPLAGIHPLFAKALH